MLLQLYQFIGFQADYIEKLYLMGIEPKYQNFLWLAF